MSKATINLLPRKEFEILHDGKVIKGQYGTWALKRFCQRQKASLSQIATMLSDPTLDMMFDYILSAIEYSARKENQPFSWSDFNISEWIDDMDGAPFRNLLTLFNHSIDEDLREQKKRETEPGLNGTTSSASTTAQEEQLLNSGVQP